MNKFIGKGNCTKDWELRMSQNGNAVGRNSMALNRGKDRDGKELGADFINIIAFGKTAETLSKYTSKGSQLLIEGHIQSGSYEKDGHKVYTTDVIVDRFEFVGSKSDSKPQETKSDEWMNIPDDIAESLPFN